MTPRQTIQMILTIMVGLGCVVAGFFLIGKGGIGFTFEDFAGLALVGHGIREFLSLV